MDELVVSRWNGKGRSSIIVPGTDAPSEQRAYLIAVRLGEHPDVKRVDGPIPTGNGFQIAAYGTLRGCVRAFTAACPLDQLRFEVGH